MGVSGTPGWGLTQMAIGTYGSSKTSLKMVPPRTSHGVVKRHTKFAPWLGDARLGADSDGEGTRANLV